MDNQKDRVRVRDKGRLESRNQTHAKKKHNIKQLSCVPLSAYSDTSGDILVYMCNRGGTFKDFLARISRVPKAGVEIVISIEHGHMVSSHTMTIFKAGVIRGSDEEVKVNSGDILRVTVTPLGDGLGEVVFSCLYVFNPVVSVEKIDEGIHSEDRDN